MKNKKFVALGAISAAFIGLLVYNTSLNAVQPNGETSQDSKLAAFAKFTKVVGTIQKYYVDELSLEDIVKKSLQGLLTNLDAHSGYLDEKQYKDLKVETEGEFGGLGITVGMKNGALTVIAPIEGTPAYKAGIQSGDVILKINEKSTINMTIDEAVNIMRGKPKTKIELTIVRKSEAKPLKIAIIREIINIQSVYGKRLDGDIAYIRVTSFDKKVVDSVKKELEKIKTPKGIVLDLRNNPGGLLDQAVGLTDMFVEKGIIVSQKGRVADENIIYNASGKAEYKGIPMTVLINGGSASASEIVSGSLQDNKRAVVVGEKSFGKGSVQVVLPIDKSDAIRLTIARYFLPSGRTIQAVGVTPDVAVAAGVVKESAEDNFNVKEADLKQHLESELEKLEKEKATEKTTTVDKTVKPKKEELLSAENLAKDLQLQTAIGIVKALIITKK
ncbi:MAG TPA: S41 family peptidase [Campylobacterales bacterium]|nr:S41 family peptidase [Campylobacterales bacterium]